MDFGFVSLESLVGPPENGAQGSDPPEAKPKLGSGTVKQERSVPQECEQVDVDGWRASKVAKTTKETMTLSQEIVSPVLRSNSLFPCGDTARQHQEQMLSFSSNKPDLSFLGKDGDGIVLERSNAQSQSSAFPYYQRMPRYTGYGTGSLSQTMHVPMSGIRGAFTASQWIELEHQALIFKYIASNVSVPSNLLLPLKKSLNPFGFSASSTVPSSFPPTPFHWGSFHVGFADNSDPEPGRCRRTDGKKWRCSRDAVADQKYCERHINRGRHRSRKPVETPSHLAKSTPLTSSSPSPSPAISGRGGGGHSTVTSNNDADNNNDPSAGTHAHIRMQGLRGGLSVISSSSLSSSPTAVNLKSKESAFVIAKQDGIIQPCSKSQPVFGLVSSDSLLNPSQDASYMTSKPYASPFLDFGSQGVKDHRHNPLRHFIDDWPKENNDNDTTRPVISWPDEVKPEWTQLSMSIPMASSSGLSLAPNSPRQERPAVSPLRLSREFEPPMPTSLDVAQRQQANWVPITWGSNGSNCSMGGPLGEVLTNTSSSNAGLNSKNPSASLNLLTEGWDGSPQLGSSPTGVLQRSTFCSLSNSSTGSSPRADNSSNNNKSYICKKSNNVDGTSVYDEVLGSTLACSSGGCV